MWEAIRSNQRRSWLLILFMVVLLVALGASIGGAVGQEDGLGVGVLVALGIWFFLWVTAMVGGDSILLSSAGARKIAKRDAPMLWNIVEEMTIAAGLTKPPDVYVIDDPAANAFAVGRKPEVAAVAVTTGLLKRLNRDELQGVVAHEIGHVKNLDIRFMTLAAVMMGAIAMLAEGFLHKMRFFGRGVGRVGRGGKNAAPAQIVFLVLALLLAILAPIAAQMLYFACSRKREYLADASAARYTRFPEGLASALEKIARPAEKPSELEKNRVLAPMYIINPRQALAAAGAFATHPPVAERVKILRAMGGGAGFADYEAAFRKVKGEGEHAIGERTLREAERVEARESASAASELEEKATIARAREAIGMFDRETGMRVVACECGMRIKLPPAFDMPRVVCPRCDREHATPA